MPPSGHIALTAAPGQTYRYTLRLNLGENNAMKKSVVGVLAAVFAVAMLGMTASAVTAEETVTGMLVEAGCAAMGGTNPSAEHVACMVRCAKNGDPIGILTEDGPLQDYRGLGCQQQRQARRADGDAGPRDRRDPPGGRGAAAGGLGRSSRCGRTNRNPVPRRATLLRPWPPTPTLSQMERGRPERLVQQPARVSDGGRPARAAASLSRASASPCSSRRHLRPSSAASNPSR